jgi:hypothetical protein
MKKKEIMKRFVWADLAVSFWISLAWGVFGAMSSKFNGQLAIAAISAAMVCSAGMVELLPFLTKKISFRGAVKAILLYDILFIGGITVSNILLGDIEFATVLLVGTIPYGLLAKLAHNKYRGLMSAYYPKRVIESVASRQNVLESRANILGVATAGLTTALGATPREVVWLFILFAVWQAGYGTYVYMKYYRYV